MKLIYLVRHGESTTNAGNIVVGPTAPLTEIGKRQASQLAERLRTVPIDRIVHTTFARSIETAEILSQSLNIPRDESALFNERRHPSHVRGLEKTDSKRLAYEEAFWGAQFHDPNYRHFDAENFADLKLRARDAFCYLEQCEGEHVAVVGHGIFFRIMLAYLMLGDALDSKSCQNIMLSTEMGNCAISIFRYGGRQGGHHGGPWELIAWNDVGHLE